MVADLLRGLTVAEARQQLTFTHRPSSVPMLDRLLRSAVANARDTREMPEAEVEDLVIGEITVDSGPTLKRFRAAAMGRGVQIRKRTSHATVKLYTQG